MILLVNKKKIENIECIKRNEHVFLLVSYSYSEMANSPRKRSSPTIANVYKAFARPVEEEMNMFFMI